MIVFSVEFTKSAKKEFDKLAAAMQEKVLDAVTLLAHNPFSELLKIKKLKGADQLYRLRIGDYRVVYEVRQQILRIVVITIGHRKDVYRKI